jgi:hypothetical protein
MPIGRLVIGIHSISMLMADIDFFDIRLFDLIEQPMRIGQEADGVGSAKRIQACWGCASGCEGPRGPDAEAIGKAAS